MKNRKMFFKSKKKVRLFKLIFDCVNGYRLFNEWMEVEKERKEDEKVLLMWDGKDDFLD